ncbi:pimeloyl-CoA dehydrogenase large subunit, partial [Burkholderia pseudomallei]
AVAGGGAPGAASSMLKIRGTQIRQAISSLMRRAMGPYAQPFVDAALDADVGEPPGGLPEAASAAAQSVNNRKLSICGGSNVIQKN